MPPTTRKRGAPSSEAPEATPAPAQKRRRASQASPPKSRTNTPASRRSARVTVIDDDDDDLFGEKAEAEAAKDDEDIIDLATSDEIPAVAAARPPKEDRRVKISAFQCAICMDDCTDLTVTHCGHLFCAECLHSALHIEATRNKCPICRTKIDNKDRNAYSTKTKGFWPLELKLMTASDLKGKGKQR
ncbi:hypothetical protein ACHAQH_002024 [Verticillium albo-atrum]